jgi:hypothetical protein
VIIWILFELNKKICFWILFYAINFSALDPFFLCRLSVLLFARERRWDFSVPTPYRELWIWLR